MAITRNEQLKMVLSSSEMLGHSSMMTRLMMLTRTCSKKTTNGANILQTVRGHRHNMAEDKIIFLRQYSVEEGKYCTRFTRILTVRLKSSLADICSIVEYHLLSCQPVTLSNIVPAIIFFTFLIIR
uniref:Uncharacterized protein n=1 Tax=Cacopsylla melanoneura TaxID=428564 RepID=A0A8D8X255_9HEMI